MILNEIITNRDCNDFVIDQLPIVIILKYCIHIGGHQLKFQEGLTIFINVREEGVRLKTI